MLILLGCAGNLSNQELLEDGEYLAMLPLSDDLAVLKWPAKAATREGGEPSTLYALTREDLGQLERLGYAILDATEPVASSAPTERGDGYRTWGPGAWDAWPGSFLRAEMVRGVDESIYGLSMQAASSSEGPWQEFIGGPITAAERAVTWDGPPLDAAVGNGAEGTFHLTWGEEVVMTVGDVKLETLDTPLTILARVRTGWLEARVEAGDLVSQWNEDGSGRGDFVGSAEERHECWDAQGLLLWASGPEGESGDPTLCTFEDPGPLQPW